MKDTLIEILFVLVMLSVYALIRHFMGFEVAVLMGISQIIIGQYNPRN